MMEKIKSDESKIKTEIKVENFTEIRGDDYSHAFTEDITCEERNMAVGYQPISEIYQIPISKHSLEISKEILQLDEVKSLPLSCRLCANQANDMIFIFGSTELQKDIANKIDHCLPIEVKQTDNLPKQVCNLCVEKLELCYQFHVTVTHAEKQFLMYDEQMSGRVDESEECYKTLPQRSGQRVVINDAEELNTAHDGDENKSESSTIVGKLLTIDGTEDKNINSLNLKKNSKPVNNPKKTNIRTRSSSHKSRSAKPFTERVNLQIKQEKSYSALDNPVRETPSREKSQSDEDASADSELYSPPVIRRHKNSNCLREKASKDKSHDNIRLSGKEAIEHHTSTGQSAVGRLINCRICRELFHTTKQCYIHGSIHASTNYYPCCLCDEIVRTEEDWNEHWTRHDIKRRMSTRKAVKHPCDECGEEFVNEVELKSHKLSHKSCSFEPCNERDETMDSDESLKMHMLVAHRGREKFFDDLKITYSCFICRKEFTTKANLNNHIRTHTGDRPFKCDFCAKTFITKQSRKEHVRRHTGERPFECPICLKAFTVARILKRHVIGHSEKKSYKCSLCNKLYSTSHSRTVHMTKFHG